MGARCREVGEASLEGAGMGVSEEWETTGPWGVCLAAYARRSELVGEGREGEGWWRVRSKGPALHVAHRRPAPTGGEVAMLSSNAPAPQLPTLPSARTTATKAWGGKLLSTWGEEPAAAAAGEPEGWRAWRLCVAAALLGRGMRWGISETVLATLLVVCCLSWCLRVGQHTRYCCASSATAA